jgi:hypothetical protein
MTNVPEPDSGIMGFIEDNPNEGLFSVDPSMGNRRVWCEYHVWHNLDENSV